MYIYKLVARTSFRFPSTVLGVGSIDEHLQFGLLILVQTKLTLVIYLRLKKSSSIKIGNDHHIFMAS